MRVPRRPHPSLFLGVERLLPTLCAWSLLLAATANAQPTTESKEPGTFPQTETRQSESRATEFFAGQSLADALATLQNRGLEIVFNSRVVRDEMTVTVEPTTTTPRSVLDQLLAPHGLVAHAVSNDRLVVLPAVDSLRLTGSVRDERTGAPLAGASISIGDSASTRSSPTGSFELQIEPSNWAPPDEAQLRVTQIGYFETRLPISAAQLRNEPLIVELRALPRQTDEIVVTPSRITFRRTATPPPLAISRQLAAVLPGIADDPIRGLAAVPGVTAPDSSARLSVRGGPPDGVQLLLDGMELYEPFHLQDFGGASTIVAPETLESIDVLTGTVPARYGGRSSGVIDMRTLVPMSERQIQLSAGLLDSHLLGSGPLPKQSGYWLGLARVGTFDPALRFDGRRDQPSFWDLFGKIERRIGESNTLTLRSLLADDHLDFKRELPQTLEELHTRYQSGYLWGTYAAALTPRLFSEIGVSTARLRRQRRASEQSADLDFDLEDRRNLVQFGVRNDTTFLLSSHHTLSTGLDARYYDTHFRYDSAVDSRSPLANLRTEAESGSFFGGLREQQGAVYISDLYRPRDDLTLDLGLRFEGYTLTDRGDAMPRLAVAYWLDEKRVVRLSWGAFIQNQRPYELQVTDGETEFARGERSDQYVISFEQALRPHLLLRLEAYRRTVENPRARFVNLFEPRTAVPEVQNDRVRIAPERSEAAGIELLLRSTSASQSWWVHYAHARTRDRIDGRSVPNSFDQPDAVTLQYERRLGSRWTTGAVWRYHTGWPTTRLTATTAADPTGDSTGEMGGATVEPVLGKLFAEHLPAYHRLDLRVARSWPAPRGQLDTYIDLQNVYNRRNVRGFEFELQFEESAPTAPSRENSAVNVDREEKFWRGFFASAGVRWTF